MTTTTRPGYLYMDGNTTTAYVDNHEELRGAITTLKIHNDGANDLQFIINRAEDSTAVDGIVKAGEKFELPDVDQGISSVAVKSGTPSAFRLWAYH